MFLPKALVPLTADAPRTILRVSVSDMRCDQRKLAAPYSTYQRMIVLSC